MKPRSSFHTTTAHSTIAAPAPKPAASASKLFVPAPKPQVSAAVIKPPPRILSRSKQQLRSSAHMITPGASRIKPAPEDLVAHVQHEHDNIRNSYESTCDE